MKSLMRYAGGKIFMLKDVYEIFHQFDSKIVVDVFGGSGKFLLNLNDGTLYGNYHKVYNDIDDNMVNLFNVIRNDDTRKQLIERFEYYISSRSMLIECQKSLKDDDKIEWAYRVLYILINAFNAQYNGVYRTYIDGDVASIDYYLDNMRQVGKELRNWTIENLDFETLIKRYDTPNTFFYFDPPYYGLNYYRYSWNEYNFKRFKRALDTIQGHYIMNINDTPEVRSIYGEPQLAKEYTNHSNNLRNTEVTLRTELYYWK